MSVYFNNFGRYLTGSTFAGGAITVLPRVLGFAANKILAGHIGSAAAAALAVPATGAASTVIIPAAFYLGGRVWNEGPGYVKTGAFKAQQAYRTLQMRNLKEPTTTERMSNGQTVTWHQVPFFRQAEDESEIEGSFDFVDSLRYAKP